VRKEALVVTCREVETLVGAARFLARERRDDDRLGDVEHERQFQRDNALRVERSAAVRDRHVGRALAQALQLLHRFGQRLA
jgi:hypothetical protein